jgi:hypothetical protein
MKSDHYLNEPTIFIIRENTEEVPEDEGEEEQMVDNILSNS